MRITQIRTTAPPAARWNPSATAALIAMVATLGLAALVTAPPAHAFCGFYVTTGDAKLLNRASKVVLVRDGDRTVLTMANDFKGEPREFAIVVPVPTVLEKSQIHVGEKAPIEHLDAYSAPRLVEYFDEDPCMVAMRRQAPMPMALSMQEKSADAARAKSLGVTIEARYTVGEYDILILSAKQSGGLEQWLQENNYRVPAGASRVLGAYIKQGMKFFVAKVNLKEQSRLGFSTLRPIQVAYESPKFMLPIRLGMVNADGPQELLVFALTRDGRVEAVNYRTLKIPSDLDVPLDTKDRFPAFYRALFTEQSRKENLSVVFTEYAWDMSWCDPCAADPLSRDELRGLGVFWLDDEANQGQAQQAFVTRLHLRYDAAHFPEDLVFQQTADKSNFQARYVMHHAWKGDGSCPALKSYRETLRTRQEQTARNVVELTGWSYEQVVGRMRASGEWVAALPPQKWWERIWNQ